MRLNDLLTILSDCVKIKLFVRYVRILFLKENTPASAINSANKKLLILTSPQILNHIKLQFFDTDVARLAFSIQTFLLVVFNDGEVYSDILKISPCNCILLNIPIN